MTKRLEVNLDESPRSLVRIAPQIIQNIESEELSVEKWSETAVEKMFEAADNAMTECVD